MSLHDKVLCLRCLHPRHTHTGNHVQGTRTACREQLPLGKGSSDSTVCVCHEFVDIETGMEIQGVYDGVLFWIGTDGCAYHRFHGDDPMTLRLRRKALPYINQYNRREEFDGSESNS